MKKSSIGKIRNFFIVIVSLLMIASLVGFAACSDGETSDVGDQNLEQDAEENEESASQEKKTEDESQSVVKQAPIYQGMVISSTNTLSAVQPYSAGDLKGDLVGREELVDDDRPFGDDSPTIEQEVEQEFKVVGAGQDLYYADLNEDIYITVIFSNPNNFEILSFAINGKTYASYMFESGSDMENIIIKLNVGSVAGINDYVISEIKYVDGTEIKDVLLNGDTAIKCGVRGDEGVKASVSNESVSLDSISFSAKISDLYSLMDESDGFVKAVLYDGSDLLEIVDLEVGNNEVEFEGLYPNTLYQYAVVAVYDDLSGNGNGLFYLYKNTVYTEAQVLFKDVEVTKTSVSFDFEWHEGYDDSCLHTKFTLEGASRQFIEVDPTSREITDLLSNHEYTLNVAYTGIYGETEAIRLTFTTLAMETPEVDLDITEIKQDSISYAIAVTDEDETGEISSIALYRGNTKVYTSEEQKGTFDNLLSDTEYTLTVVYEYDLNDGNGTHALEVSELVTTLAKAVPEISISSLTSTHDEIEYELSIVDEDGVGEIKSITLYLEGEAVGTIDTEEGSFDNLLSGNEYTLVVVYKYDLNDGQGERIITLEQSISTLAKAVPEAEIEISDIGQEGFSYEIAVTDEDAVGALESVTLILDGTVVETSTSMTGTFSDLLSDTEYTLTVVYEYDLNDGTGSQTLEISKTVTTLAKAAPEAEIEITDIGQEGFSYEIAVTDEDAVGALESVTLILDGTVVETGTSMTGTFSDLLSDTEYTLTVVYEYDLNDGNGTHALEVSETVTTMAKVVPEVSISSLTSTQEEIAYELSVNDGDGVGEIESVTLYHDGEAMGTGGAEEGSFDNLLSGNEYTLVVVYKYDLNDGQGERIITLEQSISTFAKAAPDVEIESIGAGKRDISFELSIEDTDETGKTISVTLSKNGVAVADTAESSGTFENLLSDNEYTLTVVYTFDLNDGSGLQTMEISEAIKTLVVETPDVEIKSLTATATSVAYELTVTDADAAGSISSATLYFGEEAVAAGAESAATYDGLLSDNEYTLVVVYAYDLNDGTGEKYIFATATISTLAKSAPTIEIDSLESTKDSISYGITVSDADETGSILSVTVYSGDEIVYTGTDVEKTIGGLLSGNEYKVAAIYVYDLNDGTGTRTIELSESVYTEAKVAPVVTIEMLDGSRTSLTFSVEYTDGDAVGTMTGIGLYAGDALASDNTDTYTGEMTYEGLSSYTCYTLTVSYKYDLNDGAGWRYETASLSAYTDPVIEFVTIEAINTSAVSEGDTITIQATMYNPNGVKFSYAVINGITYDVSSISTPTFLYIDLVNNGQFIGGDTDLVITQIIGTLGGVEYVVDIGENNVAEVFINGELYVESFSIVSYEDGAEEERLYRFKGEQLYYKLDLMNATGYDIESVTIGGKEYYSDDMYVTEDKQIVYVALPSDTSTGWRTDKFSGISFKNESIEKFRAADMSVSYVRLSTASDGIVEIYTADQLKDVSGWKYFKLMCDIDLSDYEWVNVGNTLQGVFDGNGHIISNVKGITTYTDMDLYLGLFESVEGVVTNLEICDVLYIMTLNSTTGNTYDVYAGALAGKSNHMVMTECIISSSIQVTNTTGGTVYMGALSGSGSSTTELYSVVCYFTGEIISVKYGTYGFFGNRNIYKSSDAVVVDSRCDYNLTYSTDIEEALGEFDEYVLDEVFVFKIEDGVYKFVNYLGNEKSVTLPASIDGQGYEIGDDAFRSNSSIEEIIIPEGVTAIGEYAFYYCTSLKHVVIPYSVTSIGSHAFYHCTSLSGITIPDGVAYIGQYAFAYCDALIEINYNAMGADDLSSNYYIFYDSGTTNGEVILTIGANVESVPAYLFYQTNITTLIFEEGSRCTTIGKYAFAYCYSLKNFAIPSSVTYIGSYAFRSCTSLTSITISESVTNIGSDAFYDCTALREINYNAICADDLSSGNYVFCYAGQEGDGITVTIGKGVKSIPAYLFYPASSSSYLPNITSIVFEEGSICESIGNYAFAYCASIASVMIPDSVKSIGNYAFYYCSSLTVVTISESVTSIGNYAFAYCTSLTSVTIPDGVASIGSYAFAYCSSVTSVTIGKGVESIGDYAFRNCTSLSEIKYYATNANSSSSNSNYAFYYAGTSGNELMVTIGANVECIPTYMFYYSNITSVLFEEGSKCAEIGYRAFNNCSTLKAIYFFGTEDDWAKISIGSENSSLTSATIYYYSEDDPMGTEENRWHYNEFGEVVIWNKED